MRPHLERLLRGRGRWRRRRGRRGPRCRRRGRGRHHEALEDVGGEHEGQQGVAAALQGPVLQLERARTEHGELRGA